MKKIIIALVFASLGSVWAQTPKTVEEILKAKDPNEFFARENKDFYLVLDKVNGKRKKIHTGDLISFMTKDGLFFQNEVTLVAENAFSIVYYDNTTNRYESRSFNINDLKYVLKRPRRDQKIKPVYILLASVPWLLVEWGLYGEKPWENYGTLATIGAVQGGSILILYKDKFFNRMKLKENKWELKVFQY